MQHVLTLFDYSCYPPKPLQSIVVGEEVRFFTFYLKGTGIRLKQIWENIAEFIKIFENPTCINDFKAHVAAFKLERHVDYHVYDLLLPQLKIQPKNELHGKKILAQLVAQVADVEPTLWRRLYANSSVVYQCVEDVGIRHGYKRVYPLYSLDTYTGRSKTTGFSVQGATEDMDIMPIRDGNEIFVHFDWIAADLRMAAVMSNDENMLRSYEQSDPYTNLAEYLNNPEFPRDVCKTQFLKAVYALQVDNPIFDIYPQFKSWMKLRLEFMRDRGYLETILQRRFVVNDNELSVFNSQFQGSVAHAMQAVLTKIFYQYRTNILAEIHDSLVLCCSSKSVKAVIDNVVPIMLDPLAGYLDDSPRMPLKVSVGRRWKQWQVYRTYR